MYEKDWEYIEILLIIRSAGLQWGLTLLLLKQDSNLKQYRL